MRPEATFKKDVQRFLLKQLCAILVLVLLVGYGARSGVASNEATAPPDSEPLMLKREDVLSEFRKATGSSNLVEPGSLHFEFPAAEYNDSLLLKLRDNEIPGTQRFFQVPWLERQDQFLDNDQAALYARVDHDPNHYVEFMPAERNPVLPPVYSLKSWTQSEKEAVTRLVAQVLNRAPGLLLAASGSSTIKLFRIRSSRDEGHGVTRLIARSGVILVPDAYFHTAKQFHFLLHELLHLADSGNHLSYSKDWVQFANPIIQQLRRQSKNKSITDQAKLWISANRNNLWPDTFFGCQNLTEAFAFYFTEYVEGSEFRCDPIQIQRFRSHILSPTDQELSFTKHFVAGQNAYERDYLLARSEFSAANELDPSVARVYLGLAGTYFHTGDIERELALQKQALDAFEAAGVPETEDYFAWTRAWYQWRLSEGSDGAKRDRIKKPVYKDYFKN